MTQTLKTVYAEYSVHSIQCMLNTVYVTGLYALKAKTVQFTVCFGSGSHIVGTCLGLTTLKGPTKDVCGMF